jgi:hypothetical protein
MGCSTTTRRVDSGGHVSLRGNVGAGVDEDSVLFSQPLPFISREMLCHECVSVVKGTHSARLRVSEIAQEHSGRETDRGDHYRSVESGGVDPPAVAASFGLTSEESSENAACGAR